MVPCLSESIVWHLEVLIYRAGSRWACYPPQNDRNPTIRCRPCGKAVYQKWLQYIYNKVYI